MRGAPPCYACAMPDYPGGCLCGAVRFRLTAIRDAVVCHCPRCRRASGAPMVAWAVASPSAWVIEAGELASYQGRRFCRDCGASVARAAGDDVAVAIASLDTPEAIAPRIHQCVEHHLPWLHLDDWLPAVEGTELPPEAERHSPRAPADPAVTRTSAVTLRPIDKDNAAAVLFADVAGNQRRFVAPNSMSLAQGYLAGDAWCRAIYAGEVVVGFVMAAVLLEDELGLSFAGDPEVWRYMIDARYQGLGLGARAFEQVLAELASWDGARSIWLMSVKGTGSAYEFYRGFGFVDTGVVADGEHVMQLALG